MLPSYPVNSCIIDTITKQYNYLIDLRYRVDNYSRIKIWTKKLYFKSLFKDVCSDFFVIPVSNNLKDLRKFKTFTYLHQQNWRPFNDTNIQSKSIFAWEHKKLIYIVSLLSKGNRLVLSPIDFLYLTRILCIDCYPQQTSERLVKKVYKDLLLICQNIFEILFPLFIANVKVVKQSYPPRHWRRI